MKGTSTACKTMPNSPAWICDHTAAADSAETPWKIAASARNTALPLTCANSTAGNAIQPFSAIFFENSPDTAANTASSAIIYGRRDAAGIALPVSDVIAKLTSGERTPTPSPHFQPSRHPPSRTGRYMGSHCTPPEAPAIKCTSCGNNTASATTPTEISDLTVIFVPSFALCLANTDSIIFYVFSFFILTRLTLR